jgi:hypothetical protein
MYTEEFITKVFEQLHTHEKAIFELTILNEALVTAMLEVSPQVDYGKYYTEAMTTPQAKEALARIRLNSERLDQLKQGLGKPKGQ